MKRSNNPRIAEHSLTLERAEDAGARGRALETHIHEGLERTTFTRLLHLEHLTVHFLLALIEVRQTELLVHTASQEETRGVRSSIVRETDFHAIAAELVGISAGNAHVVVEIRREDLARDIVVRAAHHKAVLRGHVFVLVLEDQTLAGIVVGLVLAATLELDLEALEVAMQTDSRDE
jgi:hypothetical protein